MGGGEHRGGQLLTNGAGGCNPDIGDCAHDPERARALLHEARADGVPVDEASVLVAVPAGSVPRIGEIIEAAGDTLGRVGHPSRVELREQGRLTGRLLTRPDPPRADILIQPGGDPLWDDALTLHALHPCEVIVSIRCDADPDARLETVALLSGGDRARTGASWPGLFRAADGPRRVDPRALRGPGPGLPVRRAARRRPEGPRMSARRRLPPSDPAGP